jgi:hypothetical protein
VAALAAGAFATGAPLKHAQRCFWLLAAAPRQIGLVRRVYYWENCETTCGSDFVDDSDDGMRLPNIAVDPSDADEAVDFRDSEYLNRDETEYLDDLETVCYREDKRANAFGTAKSTQP